MSAPITYRFEFEDGVSYEFEVPTTPRSDRTVPSGETLPAWTRLTTHQCSICPLSAATHEHCPAAVDLSKAAAKFEAVKSYVRARVTVVVGHRTYISDCDMNTGLRSLFGLYMALSGCPVTSRMRLLALSHVPFATLEETLSRVISNYLLKQYFVAETGETPDWDLKQLRALYADLDKVNSALLTRIRLASKHDSNLNAICGFGSIAKIYSEDLSEMLQDQKPEFLSAF